MNSIDVNSKLRISSPASMPNIGMSLCPGKIDPLAGSGPCARNLEEDIGEIYRWGATRVVTLMEQWELHLLHVDNLGFMVQKAGMKWDHWEVIDQSPLRLAGATRQRDPWAIQCEILLGDIKNGQKIFIHCRGGLGRTGTLAARLLIENGISPEKAIREVRTARPNAIETLRQELYLLNKSWK